MPWASERENAGPGPAITGLLIVLFLGALGGGIGKEILKCRAYPKPGQITGPKGGQQEWSHPAYGLTVRITPEGEGRIRFSARADGEGIGYLQPSVERAYEDWARLNPGRYRLIHMSKKLVEETRLHFFSDYEYVQVYQDKDVAAAIKEGQEGLPGS